MCGWSLSSTRALPRFPVGPEAVELPRRGWCCKQIKRGTSRPRFPDHRIRRHRDVPGPPPDPSESRAIGEPVSESNDKHSARVELRVQVDDRVVHRDDFQVAVLPGQDVGTEVRSRADQPAALFRTSQPDRAYITVNVIPQASGFDEPYVFTIDADKWQDFVAEFGVKMSPR